jgi:hypothetical protein
MPFLLIFSRIALFISGFSSVVGLFNVGLIVFAMNPDRFVHPAYDSGITLFMSQHLRAFALAHFVVSMIGLLAAVALLKRRRWGLQTWCVLLALGIVWAVVATAITLLFPGPYPAADARFGDSGVFPVLWRIFVPFNGLVGVLLFAWLLKRLLSPEVQAVFTQN